MIGRMKALERELLERDRHMDLLRQENKQLRENLQNLQDADLKFKVCGMKQVPESAEFFIEFTRDWNHFKGIGRWWKKAFWEQLLAAAPEPPEAEPLTDEEIAKAVRHLYASDFAADLGLADDINTARAIEKRIKEGK